MLYNSTVRIGINAPLDAIVNDADIDFLGA